jgi:TonB-dependent SusC/RagA subfamily outer membrane receptor
MFIVSLFLFVGTALAQTKVTGTVLSQEDGEPIIGATIKIVGAGTGAITDYDGQFTVTMPEGKDMIEITYLGCKTETLKAVNGMRVMMKPDTETLEEVVVVAYGTAKKQSITGSVSTVDQKVIEKRITSNVTSALEGAAPGVQVNNTYGEPGAEPTIRIRGIGSLNGSNTPLYVVDGIIYNGNIADLNPEDIKTMSVLKDAASAALYGNRASAGVVIITTKSGVSKEGNSSIDLKINHGFYNRGIA